MREVVILGVGMHQFGRFPEKPIAKIGAEAVIAAVKDAGIQWKEIPMMYCAHAFGGSTDGQRVAAQIGDTGIPIVNLNNACAGGNTSVFLAYQAVAFGIYDIVLSMGVDQAPRGPLGSADRPSPENVMGIGTMMGMFAMFMQRAIYEHRCTLDQMAWVSVKNHNNGCLNPYAQYKIPMKGVEDVHSSRMIADPMTLYHCCPTGDGAAASILCTEEIARRYTTPPFIKFAGGALTSQIYLRPDHTDTEIREPTIIAANQAYEIAGIGPEDVDMVELHDNFTISEIDHIADLGLCEEDEVGPLMEKGAFNINGRIPVTMSGGLLAKGHPTAATGVSQICELVWQLRGQAGQRQVNDPKVGLAHSLGGQEGLAFSVNIVKK